MPPRVLALALCCLCAARGREPAPLVRVAHGTAKLAEEGSVRALDPRAGVVTLVGAAGWLEAGPLAEVELVWRGLASARIHGPAAFELGRQPELVLSGVARAELEVRRGTLRLELQGLATLEISAGALQVRGLPGGIVELLNRGGAEIVLRRGAAEPVRLPAGRRLRLRADA